MAEKEKCGKPAGPTERMCKLKKDGKVKEIDLLELNPIVYCSKCLAKANDPSTLCNPRAIKGANAVKK